MSESINLKEIKRQVYLYYSEDGLADVAVGLVIFGFGVLLLVDLPAMVGLLGLIPFLVWYFGKQTLVIPRVGSIQMDQEMKKRFVGFFTNLVILGAGVLVLYLVSKRTRPDLQFDFSLALFGFVLALGISSLGLALKTNRFYLYALLVFLAMTVGEFLGRSIVAVDPYLIAVIAAGGIILITGIVVLFRFLKKYPVVVLED
ncbi:MAG: hypothetical protein WBB69_14905 [Anaerolineales bacterium]